MSVSGARGDDDSAPLRQADDLPGAIEIRAMSHDVGIDALASILTVPMPWEDAVADASTLLADVADAADVAERMMRLVLVGCAVAAG